MNLLLQNYFDLIEEKKGKAKALDALEDEIKAIKNQLILEMGDAQFAEVGTWQVTKRKSSERGIRLSRHHGWM
jgi:hypothetical protein